MAGSISVSGGSTSTQSGQRSLPTFEVIGSADIGVTLNTEFEQGDNTFTVPTGAVGVVILPWNNQLQATWTLRSSLNGSDTGLPIPQTHPTTYVFPSTAPASVIINASAASSPVDLWFW